jgi:ClpP class serine protease
LEQLRKEEREETLRDLEARFRDMLLKQRPINEGTAALDQVGRENFKRAEQLQLADLATNERALSEQAATCLHILDEEGTTVAFPRVVSQLSQDMGTVADRLAGAEVGTLTQTIEQEIVDTLEQLLDAVKKMQQENEQQQGRQSSSSDKEPPLLPPSAELKLLKASQQRINTRTAVITDGAATGKESPEAAARGLKGLAARQVQCSEIAKQMRDRQGQ